MGRENIPSTDPDTYSRTYHILVIRLSAMGDVAMTAPVLATLVDQYPQLRITVLTRAIFGPIFNGLPNVTVYNADVNGKHKGLAGLWRLYREVRDLGIDAVADLHNVLRSNILKVFFHLGSLPFAQIHKGRQEKRALTSLSDKDIAPLRSTHQRYADVFAHLGFPISLDPTSLLPKRVVSDMDLNLIGAPSKRRIGLAPFAAFDGKMYPLDLMEQVVDRLNKTDNYQILLFGGGEKERIEMENWSLKYDNCINLVGSMSLDGELAVISQLDLMVAMDSGNAHLAAMFGVPTVTLWGVTHPYAGFYPFAQPAENALLADRHIYPFIPTSVYGNKYPPGYENAMRTISPEAVLLKIDEVLNCYKV